MALSDKNAYMQVIGSLLTRPSLLDEGIGHALNQDDFDTKLLQTLFISIYNLYKNGAKSLSVIDIDNYLRDYPPLADIFNKQGGIQYLQDATDISLEANFDYYCERVKKFSALRALKAEGIDIDDLYNDKETDPAKDSAQRERFDAFSLNDLFVQVGARVAKVESKFSGAGTGESGPAADGIAELIEQLKRSPEIGYPLQGNMWNTIVRGARLGKFYLRSASSGTGKSRLMFGDATLLAYPWRFSETNQTWERHGSEQKVLIITTELDIEEVQTIILANLTNLNEEKILYGFYTKEEEERMARAVKIMTEYRNNLIIEQIPDPNIARIKAVVRKHHNMNDIRYLFYDYIFTSPSLLSEFRDIKVREDVALGMLGTALKDLAVELNIFVMSATQLSGDYENAKTIKTQTLLRGAKSLADKTDIGSIVSVVAKEDLVYLDPIIKNLQCEAPTLVIDLYKIRRGRYKSARIWSKADLGTGRIVDLFATDLSYNPLAINIIQAEINEEAEFPVVDAGETIDYETGEILKKVEQPLKNKFKGMI